MKTYYVDVLLPLHVDGFFTYRVPKEMEEQIEIGKRVVVQFGRSKLYSAIVRRIHQQQPKYATKYVMSVLDERPIVTEKQMDFWEWVGRYYMCTTGDVMAMVLPSGMKIASDTAVSIHPDFSGDLTSLSHYEMMVVNLLTDHPKMKVEDLSKAIGLVKIMPLLRSMIENDVVMMYEELQERYKPRLSQYLLLSEMYREEENQRRLFEELEKKKRTKQLEVLMTFLQMSHFGQEAIPKRHFSASATSVQTMIKNGIFTVEEREEHSLLMKDEVEVVDAGTIVLNEEQQWAYESLSEGSEIWQQHRAALLYGVTSSGKTEVYIKLIDQTIRSGRQALFLLPEIALTTQVTRRLQRYFGDKIAVYHSRLSTSQRVEIWRRTLREDDGGLKVVLGARSAMFLPFRDLGLVIVDEEHDPSYKQQEPTPRYNARDCALFLARMWQARVVLGSATPSVESYHNALQGKYGLVTIKQRYGGYEQPMIECIDLSKARREDRFHNQMSDPLIDAINDALREKRQVILFLNRRGFAPHLECDDCHYIPQCVNCDVSLVYHKAKNSLQCHYCGYEIPVPDTCPQCGGNRLRMSGIGTERIEDDLHVLFPDANIERMDLDSTSQKNRYVEILNDFESHRIDILVGTQMVTKGLDFDNVGVVGIVNADNIINFPNFRSFERAYQLMTQVSGRAGRHGGSAKVMIQTYSPNHPVIADVMAGNYEHLFNEQINERRVFRYPPYYRLIEIMIKHEDKETLDMAADYLYGALRNIFMLRVIGPQYPLVPRIRGQYIKMITIRFEKSEPIADAKKLILESVDEMKKQRKMSGVVVSFDVDPY